MKICIWTGAAWERWGPTSISKGIGGSETAAVHMGFELARLGHDVVMVGDHEGHEGTYGAGFLNPLTLANMKEGGIKDVVYVNYDRAVANPRLLDCDVFVSSRDKRAVRLKPNTKKKVLWVHDVDVGDDWENDLLDYDLILGLTKWHTRRLMDLYSHVDPARFATTSNGVDLSRFDGIPLDDKKPHFVFSSSPDRGLDVLLDLWPKIRFHREDAELHIYYGFEQWRRLNAKNKKGLLIIDDMEARVRESQAQDQGVFFHGRVGQRELAEAHAKAICWAYPSNFCETFCISALEAQVVGSVPVTSNLAGLAETARLGRLVTGHNKTTSYRDQFLANVVQMLHEHDNHRDAGLSWSLAEECRTWARRQTWEAVARQWVGLFSEG